MQHEKWNSGSTGGASDYQPTEQELVAADYWNTRVKKGEAAANAEFEWQKREASDKSLWKTVCPDTRKPGDDYFGAVYRRKPRTVTLKYGEKEWELPLMYASQEYSGGDKSAVLFFDDIDKRDQWLAALREIAGGESGRP